MNELQFVCPHRGCGKLVLEGTDQVISSGDILKCQHCKQNVIIEEIVYRLNVRRPE